MINDKIFIIIIIKLKNEINIKIFRFNTYSYIN